MTYKTKEELAKYVIHYYLEENEVPEIKAGDVAENLHQKAACFVTVYIYRKLRGCIGNYEAFEPLYKNIIRNAISAITSDYRFSPITKEEIPNLTVEVSVLSPMGKYKPKDSQELLKYLTKNKPGLLLDKDGRKAIFLPQVWEDLPKAQDFLSNLCLKAGLNPDDWQDAKMRFWVFRNIKI